MPTRTSCREKLGVVQQVQTAVKTKPQSSVLTLPCYLPYMVCCSKHWITKLKSLFHKENWLVDMKRSLRYHLYNIKATMAGESAGNIPRLNDRPIWFLCFFSSFPSLLCSYLSIFFLKKKKSTSCAEFPSSPKCALYNLIGPFFGSDFFYISFTSIPPLGLFHSIPVFFFSFIPITISKNSMHKF